MMTLVRRYAAYPIAVAALVFTLAGCGDSNVQKAEKSTGETGSTAQQTTPPAGDAHAPTAVAEVSWTVPGSWQPGPPKSMRVATYRIDAEETAAECAVFYFGEGQGGSAQANIDRWISQVVQSDGSASSDKAKTEERTVNGLKINTVDVTGVYGGAGMAGAESHEGFRLLGAIVHGPKGPVFFKLTGPSDAVANAESDFNQLLGSVKSGS